MSRRSVRRARAPRRHTGSVDLHFDQHAEAKNRKVCNRNNVPGAPAGCTAAPYARVEGQGATGIADVDRAYDFAGQTYDFFRTKFVRDSLDNAGLPLLSTVKYCPDAPNCPFANAFWTGSQMVYGDGFAVDDVVGHELTHGITDFESDLFYFAQSGAINESLSDVFGEYIDLSNTQGTDTAATRWQIGEDIPSIGAIRDMEDPPLVFAPDRMSSANYATGYADNAGVHSNSGVNNKAAFLLTDGGTFNGKTVSGLGIDKVARIYYEAEVHILTSGSDYADLYDVLQQACKNLTGSNGITATNCVEVKDAVDATEMNLQPAGASVAEAPVCPAGQVPANLFFDDLENTASGNWAKSKVLGSTDFHYPNPEGAEWATSGIRNFWGPNASGSSDYRIARTANVVLPAGTSYFRFNHMFDFEFNFDGGVVEYSTNNGATWIDAGPLFNANGYTDPSLAGGPLSGRAAFTGFTAGYTSSRLDLTSLAGQAVRFRFRVGTDASVAYQGWFIDDIRVYRCLAGSSAPTANAGPNKTVNSGTAFTLPGAGTDPEGKPLAYRWVQLSGVSATIRDPRERNAAVNGVNGGGSGQDLVFQLTVTDAQGLTDTDTVNVHVNPK
ncbi:MAG: M4 family metallopeptidase [Acidimicrobiales bacterium]